ncbi:Histidine acid phosphatase, eukaryotic [Cordyceps fumosorosea ARSEF 2679]|uniref:Histidine acid phosphatase, eukaryotic n=1 Tax=Cordyceps fumosorosea (strain ARSEF 2679) TaxID=1081104 RepID=A0A168D9Y0_CORFA|nr:Histidine acid phosphatase, eukaryotic [Cordyceps fumosorosea ARSEF 2679]OAA72343.1 Histidine acid phosphatase, eukaryotic [Cordyceps fumosorosea ARSEF 2679]
MGKNTALRALSLAASVSASTLYSTYNFNPLHHLTGIAPYFEPQDPAASPDAPQGCTAERAAYLVRHAAIYANDFDYDAYIEGFVAKLGNSTVDWTKVPELSFLAGWSAPISDAEVSVLTRVGRLEATQLGVDLSFRYPNFSAPRQVWTSSASRTVQSAKSFARGLEKDEGSGGIEVRSVYESKEAGADSLTPYKACPAYSSSAGSDESDEFTGKFTKPIVARLKQAAPGFNFTDKDIFGMQQLCGYETVIRGKSPFCDLKLFTPDDWLAWEYSEDIRYHYNVGYGSSIAGYNGLPWLKATGELLMSNPTNSSANSSSSVDDLLVSFTHREMPPMVIVAMGLFNNSDFGGAPNVNDTMPTDRINYRRAWKSSNILPFLGNIAIERLRCSSSYGYEDGEFYRVLVNSSPQPLPSCADGPGTSCSRDAFGKYLQQRADMFTGFTGKCDATYKNSTDTMSLYSARNSSTMP